MACGMPSELNFYRRERHYCCVLLAAFSKSQKSCLREPPAITIKFKWQVDVVPVPPQYLEAYYSATEVRALPRTRRDEVFLHAAYQNAQQN